MKIFRVCVSDTHKKCLLSKTLNGRLEGYVQSLKYMSLPWSLFKADKLCTNLKGCFKLSIKEDVLF